jgi:hypothetical protein
MLQSADAVRLTFSSDAIVSAASLGEGSPDALSENA